MYNTFARKKAKLEPPAEAQASIVENKAGSILQFLKPLGTGNSKGPKALAASAAKEGAAAAKPLQPLRPLLPTGRKPDAAVGSKPAGSKLKRRFDSQGFDFGADAIGDTSRKEADPKPRRQQQQPCQHVQLATKPKAPSAVLQRLVVRAANKAQGGQSDSSDGIEDSDSEDAAGASAHGWGKEQKGHQQQPRNLKQQVVDWEDEEPEEEGKSGAAAGDARATATDDQECWKRAAEDEPDWEEADGQESEDASEEDEDSKKNRHQQHQRGRKRAATAESASDWAPESADSDSDSEDTGSLPGEARQQARDRVKRGVRPAKPAITAAVHAVTRVALASTFGSGVRKQTGVAAGGAAATGGEMVKQEVEEALLAAVAATAEAKAARGKKRKGPAAAELPLMLPAGKPAVGLAGSLPAAGWVASYCHGSLAFSATLVTHREPAQLLCEVPGHLLNLEGDSGTIGRVAVERGSGKEAALQLDLMGIVYQAELVPLAATAAVVRMKPSGDSLVCEQLYPMLLRCQPANDFVADNEELFRDLEAYDSDRYCADSEGEKGGGRAAGKGKAPGKGKGGGKGRGKATGGSKKAGPRKTKGRGAHKKAAPRKAKAAPTSEPLGGKARGTGAARKARAVALAAPPQQAASDSYFV
ncbi:hypothetical protein CHLNCDRAFT_142962 [Chlorella variabilis]|uniref:Uncharacterized protein n=1 Tax=Chlorella variabilis TaxID=554065 RepID=E1Z964_CHLVA|nr:hypothetical protein CHLNCDRAFT_142962 [Chlorella variabilis]EFN57462.1 hypothetical protein CHLNCDRAFT_142962 [Chlorella variabilis]|eukprot:XP_005849564.1 hypothetical protein CHLNCDRAFT_142962 [Chlorella variabilis]